jgi:hypothetical protein
MTQPNEIQALLKKINDDGFPIYMMLNKLKKELKRTENFPDEVIILFSESYWKYKPVDKKGHYPYFIKTFQMVSAQWHANNQIRESAKYKNQPAMAQSVKDVLKGMFT